VCNATGLASLDGLECPLGHYCPAAAAEPIPCPAASYRNWTSAEDELDCARCPVGFHCPIGTGQPVPCEAGTYCTAGSAAPRTVPGGSYSNEGTNFQRTTCPFNHRCPRGAKAPERCTGRTVCPPGSEAGYLCPAGSYVRDNAAYQTVDACRPCPSGSFSTLSDTECRPCQPGFLCYGSTSRESPSSAVLHRGEQCPKGHYCPSGSSSPRRCPEGAYLDRFGAAALADCRLCDADSYNDLTGQSGCRPCGAFAAADEGATECRCLGAFRVFSRVDSSCRC